ncbi:MAG: DUF721 domain-containing protein [Akkermansiaceae bacterium]|nr:DUF721 domain-containing protein [Akkermansiaceae bacterium]
MGQLGFRAARFFRCLCMAGRKKKEPELTMSTPLPVARPRKRFYMQKMPDGVGERAVRVRSVRAGARDQALADFFGGGGELAASSNQRSMESLLGELLSELDLQEDSLAPELLAEAWADAVGPGLSSVSSLISVAKGRARVTVIHPTVRYEITRMKPQIIRRLNQILGPGNVKSLLIASA